MRISFIRKDEAPQRPVVPRGGFYRPEMDHLLDDLALGRIARVTVERSEFPSGSPALATEIRLVRSILLEAAAARGASIDVWSEGEHALFVQAAE